MQEREFKLSSLNDIFNKKLFKNYLRSKLYNTSNVKKVRDDIKKIESIYNPKSNEGL